MKKENKQEAVKTEADQIWDDIKNMNIDMFSLPHQMVNQYFSQIQIEPSKLYLNIKVPAALPALETALGSKYLVERLEKYITVEKKK